MYSPRSSPSSWIYQHEPFDLAWHLLNELLKMGSPQYSTRNEYQDPTLDSRLEYAAALVAEQ